MRQRGADQADDAGMLLTRRGAAALAGLLVSLVPLTACGADTPPVCSSIDDLSSSMAHLGEIQLGENGRAQLESQLADVRADLTQVRADADQQSGPQVATVTEAATAVRERAQAAKSEPSAATLQALGTAIADLGSRIRALQDAVAGTC
jgi:hypothetical protein